MLTTLLLGWMAGCDHQGQLFVPASNPDYPFLQDLGEFRVIPEEDAGTANFTLENHPGADDEGRSGVHYGGLGAPEDPAYYGGATFTFEGTGGDVCVVLDVESVYWIQAWSPQADTSSFLYEDNYRDDGDIDLSVGLTAYYTGSPGVSMGDFALPYTDEAGVSHEIEFNECFQAGYLGDGVHAGRAAVEYCTIDTFGRAGVSLTAVLDTFSLPIDDSVAHFAVGVFAGDCTAITSSERSLNECFFSQEFGPSQEGTGNVASDCDDPEQEWSYACLESKYCATTRKLNTYCEEHFDDDDTPCVDNGVHEPQDDTEENEGGDR